MSGPTVSVVVPVRDEEAVIDDLLTHLERVAPGCELVVVDGGSRDRTVERASRRARVVTLSLIHI